MKTILKNARLAYSFLVALLLPMAAEAATLSIESFTINAGEEKTMTIDLNNSDMEVTMVQFDLRLPTGLTMVENSYDIAGRTNWRNHNLNCNSFDGVTRFLLTSQNNDVLTGTSGAIISFKLKASSSFSGGTIQLENILLTSPSMQESKPADVTYTISAPAPTPKLILSASPSGGQVSAGTTVTLTAKADGSTVSGCDIYFTTDGSAPSRNNGTKYSSGITINSACTLKAIAYKSGYEDSEVLTATYTIKEDPKPKLVLSASPSGGQVSTGTTVTLTAKANGSTVSGCDIYFTTNGTTPSRNNGTKYSSGITINSACTLKAIAYKSGYEDSEVLTETYTIKEETKPKLVLSALPSGGQVSAGTTVTLTVKANGSTVSGCDIYFTTNGTTPSRNNGTKYFSGITINSACMLKAVAYKSGYEDSDVLTVTYTIADVEFQRAGVSFFSAGECYTMIVKTDGTLWACGINYGQLCDGTTTDRSTPVKVMDNVASVATGVTHTMIIKTDNSLWAGGKNSYGQLGDGTTTRRFTPVKVMDGVASVAVGDSHTMIIKTDGSLWACGYNNAGQLGDGTTTNRSIPVKVMDNVASVAVGWYYTLILKSDGTLWACGGNSFGMLGDGSTTDRHTPVKVMDGVASISARGVHTMIIKTDNSLWSCGWNKYGQLGDGSITDHYTTPIKVMDDVISVAAGDSHTVIIKTDNSLWACGYNYDGQLGDGTMTNRSTPVKVMEGVASVSAGSDHTIIEKTDGSLWACGVNNYGQLCDGTTTRRITPLKIIEGVIVSKLSLSVSLSGGQVTLGTKVYLTAMADGSAVSGCDIYYTLNGTTPTKSSTKYTTAGITINENCTLKAIAYKDGYEDSDVLTATYTAVYVPTTTSVRTSLSGYATFYSSESAYVLPNGLSAQVVTGATNGKLTYKAIADGSVSGVVPKGTAVMLVSDTKQAGTFTLTSSESTATYTGTNLLRGSDEATTTTGDGYHYKLAYGPSDTGWKSVFGWYWGAQSGAPFQIEGHKAWLVVPRGNGTRSAGFSVDGEALGIETLDDWTISPFDDCYDLQGRRVSQPARKGLYIRNGKKEVIK